MTVLSIFSKFALREVAPEARLYKVKHGAEALQFLKKAEPFTDVPEPNLLDLNMPRMDGLDVLRERSLRDVLDRVAKICLFNSRTVAQNYGHPE
jgi:CheY-like chemotaxis protein